jgi:mono/diheme cytochrome c family protein
MPTRERCETKKGRPSVRDTDAGSASGPAGMMIAMLLAAAPALAQDTPALVQRGEYLVEGIAACGNCHTARDSAGKPTPERGLAGGAVLPRPGVFRAYASNITPDLETGIGRWSDEQIGRAIREGTRPDGSVIGPAMPIGFYRGIGDDDLKAIVAYLRAQPPVSNAVPKSEYQMPLPPTFWGPPLATPVAAPPRSSAAQYGEYLAGPLGHCTLCHTPPGRDGRPDMSMIGAGGRQFQGPWGLAIARNLTPHETGLMEWTDAEIARSIREGVRKDGTKLKPPMPYRAYSRIDEADMAALIGYLRSLRPVPLGGGG